MGGVDQQRALRVLAEVGQACRRCPLAESRTHVVFGDGDPSAGLAVIGEAPGAEEDASGRPFVGAAGDSLRDLLGAAGLSREGAFVTNAVKCRPPSNRPPTAGEVAACAPLLDLELSVVRPSVIVALGATAARRLTDRPTLGRARRGDHLVDGATVIATFHPSPSGLNRDPARRSQLLADLRRAAQLVAPTPPDGPGDAAPPSPSR